MANGEGPGKAGGGRVSALDGQAPDGQDYANYFCTYAYIYHQKDMLEDHKRTGAYYNAVMRNKRQFAGKVVLDVGTGSGILAVFAAMAGARKVYAVEATSMAANARKLADANNVGNVVEVIQGTVETIELPEQVDIILSEWMGYFLLRESMLDSVVAARDRFLKPGGALYPSHARMLMAPIRTVMHGRRLADFQGAMEGWADFVGEMRSFYNVDLGTLSEPFRKEQREYYLQTSQWVDVHPSQLLGSPTVFAEYDMATVTLEELKAGLTASFELPMVDAGPVEALCAWFDVTFAGSPSSPADVDVRLDTAPDATGATHWGQQSFYLHPAVDCAPGDKLACTIKVDRRRDNHRLLDVGMTLRVTGPSIHAQHSHAARECAFHIE